MSTQNYMTTDDYQKNGRKLLGKNIGQFFISSIPTQEI